MKPPSWISCLPYLDTELSDAGSFPREWFISVVAWNNSELPDLICDSDECYTLSYSAATALRLVIRRCGTALYWHRATNVLSAHIRRFCKTSFAFLLTCKRSVWTDKTEWIIDLITYSQNVLLWCLTYCWCRDPACLFEHLQWFLGVRRYFVKEKSHFFF